MRPGYKQTEVGVIPADWEVEAIESLAHITTGGKNTQDRVADGMYPFFVRSQTVERINSYSFDGEAVLTAGDGVGTGKVFHYICGKFDVHQRVYRISNFSDRLNGYFFYLYFSTHFFNRIMQMTAKSSVDSVRMDMIARMSVPVPPTETEQRAIAAALSDVDALLGGLDRLVGKKRDLKQAAMQQLLTGQTRLPGFHGEWEVKRLGDVLRFQVGFPFSSVFFNEKEQGLRLIKNRDLKGNDQAFYYSGKYEGAFLVADGDVLVGMDGDFLPCKWAKGRALLNQRVGRVVVRSGLNRIFAYYFLIEPLKEIEDATSSTTVKHLSHSDVEGIEKPMPEVDEQTAIAAILSDMDAELAALEARRDKTRALKQGMMQELLTGRTRLV